MLRLEMYVEPLDEWVTPYQIDYQFKMVKAICSLGDRTIPFSNLSETRIKIEEDSSTQ